MKTIDKNEFMRMFVSGCNMATYKSSNLYSVITSEKTSIINYNTPIAIAYNNIIYVNTDKYSQTTTKNTNLIIRLCKQLNVEYYLKDSKAIMNLYWNK